MWKSEISSSTACDNYIKFKSSLKLEQYLTLLDPKHAIPITKFRSNNHRLPVVTGRYSNTPREERICTLCNLHSVGDEHHYLLVCDHFRVERVKFIDQVHFTNPNISNYKHLLSSTDTQELINLSTFISIILKHFSS